MINIKYLRSVEFYECITISLVLTLLCIFGIGVYRTTIFFIFYFALKSILDVDVEHKKLKVILIPTVIVALYFDYKHGQIVKYHNYGNFIYLLIILAVGDYFFNKYINRAVEWVSGGYVFSYCEKCLYENIKLTNKCNNCGYEKIYFDAIWQYSESKNHYDDSFSYNKETLRCKINDKTFRHLSLTHDEKIKISIKVNFINGIYKDDIKILCDYIVITDIRIIMLQSLMNKRGWRWKEDIYLNTIKKIEKSTRKFSVSDCKIIKFYTDNHEYEFFLWLTDKPDEVFASHFNDIKMAIGCHA